MNKGYTIRMDEATFSILEAYCKIMNVAKSEAIRKAFNNMIDENSEIKK